MKLKELKENVVVDIKSEKQCHVLMNLLETQDIQHLPKDFPILVAIF